MPLPTNESELKLFIEAKGLNDGAVARCNLYHNEFKFYTKIQGLLTVQFNKTIGTPEVVGTPIK